MGTLEAYSPLLLLSQPRLDQPVAVVGITHPQTCLVLRGRLAALRLAGFRVILISSPGEWASRLAAEEGAAHVAISMHRGMSPMADLLALARLCRAIRRLRPDLTEFSTPKAGLLGNIAAYLCRVPTRVYLLRGLRLETATGLTRVLLRGTEWLAAACAHAVVCNSESLRTEARSLGLAPSSKLRLVAEGSSNGVDTERFLPGPDRVGRSIGIPQGVPVVGYVGRLTNDKGIPELLDAFDQLLLSRPNARLLLVGWFDESEDKLSQELRTRIKNHPQIVHTGFVPDTSAYYRALDLLLLPTWREGFPNVALEAAASGIPVIATRTTGARDAVVDGVTGLLVPPGSADVLARSMELLLADGDRRAAMGKAARTWATRHFASQRVLAQTVALYESLVRQAELRIVRALATGAAAATE
jgi:glycosyltransferase involved in cell wall biosynthesis